MKKVTSLKDARYMGSVTEETIRKLTEKGKRTGRRKNTVLYRAGEVQSRFFFLMEGAVMLYTLTKAGNRKIIFVLGPGELLNESIIKTEKTTVFCESLTDCILLEIPVKDFLYLMEKDFSLTRAVLQIQEHKLWRTSHQLKNTLGSIYLERKLAAKLWKLARDFGTDIETSCGRCEDCAKENCCKKLHHHTPGGARRIELSLSITFLADFVGAPRETTSRLCKNLCDRGLITVSKKTFYVNDMACLARFYKEQCEECRPAK